MNTMFLLNSLAVHVAELTDAVLNKYSEKHTTEYIKQKIAEIKTVTELLEAKTENII